MTDGTWKTTVRQIGSVFPRAIKQARFCNSSSLCLNRFKIACFKLLDILHCVFVSCLTTKNDKAKKNPDTQELS